MNDLLDMNDPRGTGEQPIDTAALFTYAASLEDPALDIALECMELRKEGNLSARRSRLYAFLSGDYDPEDFIANKHINNASELALHRKALKELYLENVRRAIVNSSRTTHEAPMEFTEPVGGFAHSSAHDFASAQVHEFVSSTRRGNGGANNEQGGNAHNNGANDPVFDPLADSLEGPDALPAGNDIEDAVTRISRGLQQTVLTGQDSRGMPRNYCLRMDGNEYILPRSVVVMLQEAAIHREVQRRQRATSEPPEQRANEAPLMSTPDDGQRQQQQQQQLQEQHGQRNEPPPLIPREEARPTIIRGRNETIPAGPPRARSRVSFGGPVISGTTQAGRGVAGDNWGLGHDNLLGSAPRITQDAWRQLDREGAGSRNRPGYSTHGGGGAASG